MLLRCFSINVLCFAKRNCLPPITWKECTPFVPPIEEGQVIKVYDGDTITVASKLPYKDSPLYRFQVRLLGIDSPEMTGKTIEEKKAAQVAQKALEELLLHKKVYLKEKSQEKYGRILANVYVDHDGKLLLVNQWLLDNKYAVPYDGKTKAIFVGETTVPTTVAPAAFGGEGHDPLLPEGKLR